jgi:hypothetical protein
MLIREYAELSRLFPLVSVLITLRFFLYSAKAKILFSLFRVISISQRGYHPI